MVDRRSTAHSSRRDRHHPDERRRIAPVPVGGGQCHRAIPRSCERLDTTGSERNAATPMRHSDDLGGPAPTHARAPRGPTLARIRAAVFRAFAHEPGRRSRSCRADSDPQGVNEAGDRGTKNRRNGTTVAPLRCHEACLMARGRWRSLDRRVLFVARRAVFGIRSYGRDVVGSHFGDTKRCDTLRQTWPPRPRRLSTTFLVAATFRPSPPK